MDTENREMNVSKNIEAEDNEDLSIDESCYEIQKSKCETTKMFEFRLNIYNNILKETGSKKKAKIFSNIIINKLSMNCDYPQEVLDQVKPYLLAISDKDNIWLKK